MGEEVGLEVDHRAGEGTDLPAREDRINPKKRTVRDQETGEGNRGRLRWKRGRKERKDVCGGERHHHRKREKET
jgi:hypothetical protein